MKNNFETDAFASGQIGSKIWLCQELEKVVPSQGLVIWLLGGWYALTSFLLFSRGNLQAKYIRSFDIDPEAEKTADIINENWHYQNWMFKAFTQDVNKLEYNSGEYGPQPDIVINTSTEHFHDNKWFELIPENTLVVLQSNNMPHDDHHQNVNNPEEFHKLFPLRQILYKGELEFNYPEWSFKRFMLIGRR